ncbi:hypothetical protein T492DRAFT_909981 [Pavlovales sp. CCMP2436]|nr:hypothetical protein T492DRAFT_909981 [Pavlovales sp. CCMP2436]
MAEHEHVAVNVREVPVAQPADAPQQPPSSTPPPTDESMRASRAFEHKDQGKECVDVWTYDFTLGSKVYTSVPSVECWKATRPNVGTPYESYAGAGVRSPSLRRMLGRMSPRRLVMGDNRNKGFREITKKDTTVVPGLNTIEQYLAANPTIQTRLKGGDESDANATLHAPSSSRGSRLVA